MKIIVVSDTHRNFDVLEEIVSANSSADMFIHLGDGEREFEDVRNLHPEKPFLMVKGNNDWGNYPITKVAELEGHKFYITHGSRFERSTLLSYLSASAKLNGCDIALFGHTHVPFYDTVDGVHLFNPGSPSLPRGMKKPSYGIITIAPDKAAGFEIIEL